MVVLDGKKCQERPYVPNVEDWVDINGFAILAQDEWKNIIQAMAMQDCSKRSVRVRAVDSETTSLEGGAETLKTGMSLKL